MPEGDTLHRAAARLQPLVGERLSRRGAAPARPCRADRRAARRPPARGGRGDRQEPRPSLRGRRRPALAPADERALDGAPRAARPSGACPGSSCAAPSSRACSGAGRCSSCTPAPWRGSAPTSSPRRPSSRRCSPGSSGRRDAPLRRALLDQSIVAGIGNIWLAETLWQARISPWRRLADVAEPERRRALETAARRMRAAVEQGREPRAQVYGRAGRPCPRCRTRDPLPRAGRGEPHRLLVPGLPARRAAAASRSAARVGDRRPAA